MLRKAKAVEGLRPLRPLYRQHAADGFNTFIPKNVAGRSESIERRNGEQQCRTATDMKPFCNQIVNIQATHVESGILDEAETDTI